MKYWSKSALSIYKYLSTMSSTIDKLILDMGKNSNNALLQKYHSTYFQASKIIELIDRKRKMINLKIAVEDTLSRMDKTGRRILTLVFIDGVKSELVAQMLNMSIRTFFRKKNMALSDFALILREIGYDEEFFSSEYLQEKWFVSVYDDCISKTAEQDGINKLLLKKVFSELSKINYAYNTYI